MNADAVTVNPYMGGDTIEPFLDHSDKGTILLCRTSNPGSGDFQELESDGIPIYTHVVNRGNLGVISPSDRLANAG